jgi:hypothetical protein
MFYLWKFYLFFFVFLGIWSCGSSSKDMKEPEAQGWFLDDEQGCMVARELGVSPRWLASVLRLSPGFFGEQSMADGVYPASSSPWGIEGVYSWDEFKDKVQPSWSRAYVSHPIAQWLWHKEVESLCRSGWDKGPTPGGEGVCSSPEDVESFRFRLGELPSLRRVHSWKTGSEAKQVRLLHCPWSSSLCLEEALGNGLFQSDIVITPFLDKPLQIRSLSETVRLLVVGPTGPWVGGWREQPHPLWLSWGQVQQIVEVLEDLKENFLIPEDRIQMQIPPHLGPAFWGDLPDWELSIFKNDLSLKGLDVAYQEGSLTLSFDLPKDSKFIQWDLFQVMPKAQPYWARNLEMVLTKTSFTLPWQVAQPAYIRVKVFGPEGLLKLGFIPPQNVEGQLKKPFEISL